MKKAYFSLRTTHCDRERLVKRILQHYKTIAKQKKSITVNHYMVENIPRLIIYNIIQKYDTSGIVGDRFRSGYPKNISTSQRIRLKRLVNHQTGISLWKVAMFIEEQFNVN